MCVYKIYTCISKELYYEVNELQINVSHAFAISLPFTPYNNYLYKKSLKLHRKLLTRHNLNYQKSLNYLLVLSFILSTAAVLKFYYKNIYIYLYIYMHVSHIGVPINFVWKSRARNCTSRVTDSLRT